MPEQDDINRDENGSVKTDSQAPVDKETPKPNPVDYKPENVQGTGTGGQQGTAQQGTDVEQTGQTYGTPGNAGGHGADR